MKKCPWCGKNVPEEDRICPSCGFDFSRGEMSSFYDQRKQKTIKDKIRHKNEMVLVATLAIIAGGSYIFNNHQEQTEARQNIQQTTKTISDSSESSSVVSSSSSESASEKSSSSSKKAEKSSTTVKKAEHKKTAKKHSATKTSQSNKNVNKTKETKKAQKSSEKAASKKITKKQAEKSTKKSAAKKTTKVAKKSTRPAVKKQATKKNSNQLKANMKPNEFAAAVATYAAQKKVSKWQDVVNNANNGVMIKETTEPDIVNYLSAKGNGTVYVAFNSKDSSNEVVYSAYTINQDGSINIYEFGTPDAPHTGDIYNPVETVSQRDLIKYLNSHKQAKTVKQISTKVGIAKDNN